MEVGKEDEHSGPYFEERQKSLERAAAEAEPVDTPVVIPESPDTQEPVWTREKVLDFVRQNSV